MHTQDLTGSFTFEDMSPYLIYRTNGEGSTGKVETLAIWCVQQRSYALVENKIHRQLTYELTYVLSTPTPTPSLEHTSRFHNEKDKGNIAACLRKVLRLQAGSADQQAQAERQEQTHQALLEPSSMLPAAPSPQPGGGAAPVLASGSASAENKPSIEEMLLKAAPVSSPSTSPQPAPSPSPPGVMDLLLRPQALTKPPADAGAAQSSAKGLLNPMALVAAGAAAGGKGKANGAAAGDSGASLLLDKAQFKAALLSLLEEDEGWVDSLHRAYLKKAGGGHTG